MDSSLRDEPLLGHMVYEKVISLSKGPGAFKQVARNKQTGELVCIKFVPRGWDRKTAIAHTRALYNHMVSSTSPMHQGLACYERLCVKPVPVMCNRRHGWINQDMELRPVLFQAVSLALFVYLRSSAWRITPTSSR